MAYADYLRRVREMAMRESWPLLCVVADDALDVYGSSAVPHHDRLRRTLKAQLLGESFLPWILRVQRPDWPFAGADGKAIRIAWLDEQIALAEAEAGACTPT